MTPDASGEYPDVCDGDTDGVWLGLLFQLADLPSASCASDSVFKI